MIKLFRATVLALSAVLCIFCSVKAQTWKSNPVSTAWNDPANWVEGVAPTAGSNVVINSCTTCPALSSNVNLSGFTINTGGGIDLQSFSVTSTAATLNFGTITSTGGKITASDIYQLANCTFKSSPGVVGAVTIEKSGATSNGWSGGNIFHVPVTLIMNPQGTTFSYLRTATHRPDIFNEEVIINNMGGRGMVFGFNCCGSSTFGPVVFNKKLTVNGNAETTGLQTVRCEGEVVLNAFSGANIPVDMGSFKQALTLNLFGHSSIGFNTATFNGPVTTYATRGTVSWHATRLRFGSSSTPCTFSPTASLQVGPEGFYVGELRLERCLFQTTLPTVLNLSGNPVTTDRTSNLIIGGGTVFTGPVQATAPNIFLNIATYNQDATFIKTGGGANNSAGGNLFRKKLTITNQAGATFPINLATQYDDLMQQ